MITLDVSRINERSPYYVWLEGENYLFQTDSQNVYSVSFETYEAVSDTMAYWLVLTNRSHKASPRDSKVRDTIICVVEEFFNENPDILLYLCDNAKGQQAMRNRLFLRWFNTYELRLKYHIINELILDEGEENYITLVLPLAHPHYEEIILYFNNMISAFKANKP